MGDMTSKKSSPTVSVQWSRALEKRDHGRDEGDHALIQPIDHASDIRKHCIRSGADLAGIADLEPFKQGGTVLPQELLEPYNVALSIAIRLEDSTIEDILDGPTPAYAEHYRAVNAALDRITAGIVQWMAERGFAAKAIPASSIVDEVNLLGNISHKAVARMAGIGWQGKSLLIVSPEFGPRIRLATVLTDMPLAADRPLKQRCGTCSKCAGACPAAAIKNISSDRGYESRDAALFFERCANKTREFKALPGIGARICGVCVKVCPFGKKRKGR
jgi:epoxyqueuosine reductase